MEKSVGKKCILLEIWINEKWEFDVDEHKKQEKKWTENICKQRHTKSRIAWHARALSVNFCFV